MTRRADAARNAIWREAWAESWRYARRMRRMEYVYGLQNDNARGELDRQAFTCLASRSLGWVTDPGRRAMRVLLDRRGKRAALLVVPLAREVGLFRAAMQVLRERAA